MRLRRASRSRFFLINWSSFCSNCSFCLDWRSTEVYEEWPIRIQRTKWGFTRLDIGSTRRRVGEIFLGEKTGPTNRKLCRMEAIGWSCGWFTWWWRYVGLRKDGFIIEIITDSCYGSGGVRMTKVIFVTYKQQIIKWREKVGILYYSIDIFLDSLLVKLKVTKDFSLPLIVQIVRNLSMSGHSMSLLNSIYDHPSFLNDE